MTKHVIDNLEDEEKRGLINIVLYDSKRFHSMSENTLALTRMEGNVLMLSERIFDLGKLIRETVIDFKTRLNKIYLVSNPHNRKIKFEIERLEEQYLVKGDGYITSQALSNLIDN